MPSPRSWSVRLPEAPCHMQRQGWHPQKTVHPKPGAQQGPGNPACSSLLCEEPMMELAPTSHTNSHTRQNHVHAKDSPFKGYPSTAWHVAASPRRGAAVRGSGEGQEGWPLGGWRPCVCVAVAPVRAGQQMAGAPRSPLVVAHGHGVPGEADFPDWHARRRGHRSGLKPLHPPPADSPAGHPEPG